jgi:hypothetical protein
MVASNDVEADNEVQHVAEPDEVPVPGYSESEGAIVGEHGIDDSCSESSPT